MLKPIPIFGVDRGPEARHSIKFETVELRTRREVFVTGRVLVARRPPGGFFDWRELEQVDLLVDIDWRFFQCQFLPFMRPAVSSIFYAHGRDAPSWAGVEQDDQLSYSSWAPESNPFNRRLILMHTLWPLGKCTFSVDELEGKVLEMPFFTADVHAVGGEQITGAWDHSALGSKSVTQGYEVTQCPWLLAQDAWASFVDYQRRQAA